MYKLSEKKKNKKKKEKKFIVWSFGISNLRTLQLVVWKILLKSCVTFSPDIYGSFYQLKKKSWYFTSNQPNRLRYETGFFFVNCAHLSSAHLSQNILCCLHEFFSRRYNSREKNEIFTIIKISAFLRKLNKIRITLRILQSSLFWYSHVPEFQVEVK